MNKWITIVLAFIFISSINAQRYEKTGNDDEDGQYHPDDEGQYIPDNSGQYIPDYSGSYRDDGTGRYSGDKTGDYRHVEDKYRFENSFNRASRGNFASATALNSQFVQPKPQPIKPVVNTVSSIPEKYGKYDDNRWKIIKLFNDVKDDGFHWEYQTENEISGKENAKVFNSGTKDEAIRTKGFYQYTGADNKIYNVEYTADENGFIPRGNHLHPILQKAILDTLNRNS